MKRPTRIIISSILILLVIAFFVGGALFYFMGLYFPVINKVVTVPLVENSPGVVLAKMSKQMAAVTTAHYEINNSLILAVPENDVTISSEIFFDGGWQQAVAGHAVINSQIQIQNLSFLIDLEMQLTETKGYFMISEVPAVPFLDLAEVKNKWYFFPSQTTVAEYLGTLGEVKENLQNTNQFVFIDRLPDELFDGQLTYHYRIRLSKQGTTALARILARRDAEGAGMTIFNVWIDKDDYFLRHLTAEYMFNKNSGVVSVSINNFDETVTIEEPATAAPLNQFTVALFDETNFLDLPLFGYLIGLPTGDFARDTDHDSLYDIWEPLFGTDKTTADTDKDGFTDGEELRHGYNPAGPGKLLYIP